MSQRVVSSPGRRLRLARLSPLALPVAVLLVAGWQRRWMQEDGFINLRIVDQLVHGNGPVFNAGERVEAYTSPVWLAVLVVLRAVTFGLVPAEWLAVVAGIVLAAAGIALTLVGSVVLRTPRRRRPGDVWWVPVGALVVVALPATWDFASAGLETGVALAWLGGSFAALAVGARRAAAGQRVRVGAVAALIGLGPLVRPELGLYTVGFAVAGWLTVVAPLRRRDRASAPRPWAVVAALLAVPLGYQVFRMGYFATLVPNTALAKNATEVQWARGWRYLTNFAGPYRLVVPAVILAGLVVVERPFRRPSQQVIALGIVVPALLHGLYVLTIGGDYMHGRFWLIPLLALLAPLAAVPVPRVAGVRAGARVAPLVAGGAVALWALVCGALWRPPPSQGTIDDQRALVVAAMAKIHLLTCLPGARDFHGSPVRLRDQPAPLLVAGDGFRAAVGRDVFIDRLDLACGKVDVLPRPRGSGASGRYDGIGVAGYAAGTSVYLVDRFGLADPVAARLPPNNELRAGHTHDLPVPWRYARGGVTPTAAGPDGRAAMHAMTCGELGRYLRGIRGPVGAGTFLSNLVHAPGDTFLSVPLDPHVAERTFCG